MEVVVRSMVFLVLTLALIGQHPTSAKLTQEEAERVKNLLERLRSVMVQKANPPSPEPMLEGNEPDFDNDNPGGTELTENDEEKIGNALERLRSTILQNNDSPPSPEPGLEGNEAKIDEIMPTEEVPDKMGEAKIDEIMPTEKVPDKMGDSLGSVVIENTSPTPIAPSLEDDEAEFDRNIAAGGGKKITEEDVAKVDSLLKRLHSVMTQKDSSPSPAPIFDDEDDEAEADRYYYIDNPGGVHHSTRPGTFKANYEAGYKIEAAPSTGRVSFDIIDDTNQKIFLHVDARYNWYGNHHVLVLNNWDGSWKQEIRPPGFDFTAGKASEVNVKAEASGFQISQNGKNIAVFPYRAGVTVTAVTRIRVRSEGNTAAQDATLKVKFH